MRSPHCGFSFGSMGLHTFPMFHVLICCSSKRSCSSLQTLSLSIKALQSAGWEKQTDIHKRVFWGMRETHWQKRGEKKHPYVNTHNNLTFDRTTYIWQNQYNIIKLKNKKKEKRKEKKNGKFPDNHLRLTWKSYNNTSHQCYFFKPGWTCRQTTWKGTNNRNKANKLNINKNERKESVSWSES